MYKSTEGMTRQTKIDTISNLYLCKSSFIISIYSTIHDETHDDNIERNNDINKIHAIKK